MSEKLIRVKATDAYKKLNVVDNVLHRVPEEGEEFEVTESRLAVLQNNHHGVSFVEVVKPKRRTVRKKKAAE